MGSAQDPWGMEALGILAWCWGSQSPHDGGTLAPGWGPLALGSAQGPWGVPMGNAQDPWGLGNPQDPWGMPRIPGECPGSLGGGESPGFLGIPQDPWGMPRIPGECPGSLGGGESPGFLGMEVRPGAGDRHSTKLSLWFHQVKSLGDEF